MTGRHFFFSSAISICAFTVASAGEPPPSTAVILWLQGQQTMQDGETERAIEMFEKSLKLDPTLARNELSLAAACVALSREDRALEHLARYLDSEPSHHSVRAQYAELLLRRGQAKEASAEFERFVADIQDHEAMARQHLVHCHSRLMEIAEAAEDDYGEHLHRGIGLFHLAQQRAWLGEEDAELTTEGLLCQAAGELTLARLRRPREARPNWYLHQVWSRLAQAQPAKRSLLAAEEAALFGDLTPHEKSDLQWACQRQRQERSRK